MYSLEDALDSLRTTNRMLERLRHSSDIAEQDELRYASIIDLCADIMHGAEVIDSIARKRSRELRRTSRTEREMIGFIVKAIEDKPMKKHPSTNDVEAGGVKAKVLRLADGKCELCGTTMFLTCHHILPREDGGLNEEDNLIALCRSCHDEIEDLGYRTRAEIKRHTLAAKVLVSTPKRDDAEDRKAQKARAERVEAEEVIEWAAKWGEGFWGHVPYIILGDPVPSTPEWCLWVYGGARRHR